MARQIDKVLQELVNTVDITSKISFKSYRRMLDSQHLVEYREKPGCQKLALGYEILLNAAVGRCFAYQDKNWSSAAIHMKQALSLVRKAEFWDEKKRAIVPVKAVTIQLNAWMMVIYIQLREINKALLLSYSAGDNGNVFAARFHAEYENEDRALARLIGVKRNLLTKRNKDAYDILKVYNPLPRTLHLGLEDLI